MSSTTKKNITCESCKYVFFFYYFFLELIEHIYNILCSTWWKKFVFQVDYIAFFVRGKLYMVHVIDIAP